MSILFISTLLLRRLTMWAGLLVYENWLLALLILALLVPSFSFWFVRFNILIYLCIILINGNHYQPPHIVAKKDKKPNWLTFWSKFFLLFLQIPTHKMNLMIDSKRVFFFYPDFSTSKVIHLSTFLTFLFDCWAVLLSSYQFNLLFTIGLLKDNHPVTDFY